MILLFTVPEVAILLRRSFANQPNFECRMCAWQDRCWSKT